MKAYVFTDLNNVVASGTTDANGRYSMDLPSASVGKDLMLVATKGVTRVETVVCDVRSREAGGVDLNATTTVATEIVLSQASASAPKITDLDGSAVASIVREIADWWGMRMVSCDFPNNAMLNDKVGGGLRDGTDLASFVANSNTIQAALNSLKASGNADVTKAKAIVQWMRDSISTVAAHGLNSGDSIVDAAQEQQTVVDNELTVVAAFQVRMRFVQEVLGLGGAWYGDTLKDREPGRYEYKTDSGGWWHQLTKVSDAPDGKSWIVLSKINDESLDTELTITPQVAMPELTPLDPAAQQLTLTARKASDASYKLDATIGLTGNGQGYVTAIAVDATSSHSSLTSAISFNGTLAGEPVTQDSYRQVTANGTLVTQWATATVTNARITWLVSSADRNVTKAEIQSLRVESKLTKPAIVTANDLVVEFETSDPTNHFPDPTPKHVAIASASLGASGHTVSLTNVDATADRFAVDRGSPWYQWWEVMVIPRKFKGQLSYRGTALSFDGSLDASWDNPKADLELGASPVADFPKGTAKLVGTLAPKIGHSTSVDITVSSSNTVTSGVVKSTVTLAALNALGERLSGSIVAEFAVHHSIVQDDPQVTGSFTHTPSGHALTLTDPAGPTDATGTIKNSSGTKIADIARARDLSLPDLGDTVIIKYSDGSFETLASLVLVE